MKWPTRSRSDTSASSTGARRAMRLGDELLERRARARPWCAAARRAPRLRQLEERGLGVAAEQRRAGGPATGGRGGHEVVGFIAPPCRRLPTKASISARVRRSVTATSSPSDCARRRSSVEGDRRPGSPRRPGAPRRSRRRAGGAGRTRAAPARRPAARRRGRARSCVAAVARAARRAQRHLGDARGPEPTQLDRGGHRHQRLVGADVGRRLLAPDVLFSGAQRRDVGASALGVDGLADEATGQTAHVVQVQANSPRYGPPKLERHAEGLPLPHHHVGAPLAGRAQDARRTPGRRPRRAAPRCGRTAARAAAMSSRQPR